MKTNPIVGSLVMALALGCSKGGDPAAVTDGPPDGTGPDTDLDTDPIVTGETDPPVDTDDTDVSDDRIDHRYGIDVVEVTLEANFQDAVYGNLKRGRTNIVADFDNDGRQDVYLGNPGDISHIMRNVTSPGAAIPRFEPWIRLSENEMYWAASVADYDNDGDNDLFIGGGGNEDFAYNVLYRNDLVNGAVNMVDVTASAGVLGKIGLNGNPMELPTAGVIFMDYDNDADLDAYTSTMIIPPNLIKQLRNEPRLGENVMWRNNGDGTFTEVTRELGLHLSTEASNNSVAFDMDNDNDLDIFEANYEGYNFLWRNMLAETGTAWFEDITARAGLHGNDLKWPFRTFAAGVADINNDGWLDLLAYTRAFEEEDALYQEGHVVFLNVNGKGFVDVAQDIKLNNPFAGWLEDLRTHASSGVMGCQTGDLNLDGYPDVYIGNGGPAEGTRDEMFISSGGTKEITVLGYGEFTLPVLENWTETVDYKAPEDPSVTDPYPPYPYRTHAVTMADLNEDGTLELMIVNGGTADYPDEVREPNRMFQFRWTGAPQPHWLKVQPIGDGVNVNKSAIGTRVAVTAWKERAEPWEVHGVQTSVNGFAANSGLELSFGLADAERIQEVVVRWPDGTTNTFTDVPLDSRLVVRR